MAADSADLLLAEDMGRFFDDPLGFVLYAFDWDNDPSLQVVKLPDQWSLFYSSEYGPDAWACELLESIGNQVREHDFNGSEPVPAIREAISSGHGIGKLMSNHQYVDTPTGSRRWGDLKPGDSVFGSDGAPTKIIQRHRFDNCPMMRVTFDDLSYAEVSTGHLWNVRGRQERRKGLSDWRTLETCEIAKLGVKRRNGASQARQWEIPVQGMAQFEARETAVHPYLLGVWIGDGRKGSPSYTKPYPEIAEKIESLGYRVSRYPDGKTKRLIGVAHLFKGGVFDCGSHERYLPDEYKFNSVENRMALFQGLCDSDGEVHRSGSIGYATTSKQLAEDVIWLARSLGCKAMMQPTVKKAWYPDENGERVPCRDCYRVSINAPFNPFTLEHRKNAYKPSEPRYLSRWIESIEPIAPADGMCITVENRDGLYLANDFIVTHNSAFTSWIVLWVMSTRPHCKGVVTANTAEQLASKTWAEIAKWTKRCITGHWFNVSTGKGSMRMTHKQYPESWRVDAQTCREENSESFAGLHAASSSPFYIFDEASAVPDKIWEVAEGGMTDGEPMWFVFGNPTRNTGRFFNCFNAARHRWNNRHIDSRNVQITNKKTIQEWVDDFGEDSDFVRVRVRGVFPRASTSQFIPRDLVDLAMQRPPPLELGKIACVGIDVARFGDDQSVIRTRIGRDGTLPTIKMRGQNTKQVASRAAHHINELISRGFRVVTFVDGSGGYGGGVVDTLQDLGFEVVEVQFGSSADDKKAYANKRAEMWGRMRDWLAIGSLSQDADLITDLTSVEYGFTLADQVQLERKERMKDRGLASPDDADALALTFAQPVAEPNIELPVRQYRVPGGRGPAYDPFDNILKR